MKRTRALLGGLKVGTKSSPDRQTHKPLMMAYGSARASSDSYLLFEGESESNNKRRVTRTWDAINRLASTGCLAR